MGQEAEFVDDVERRPKRPRTTQVVDDAMPRRLLRRRPSQLDEASVESSRPNHSSEGERAEQRLDRTRLEGVPTAQDVHDAQFLQSSIRNEEDFAIELGRRRPAGRRQEAQRSPLELKSSSDDGRDVDDVHELFSPSSGAR